MATQQEILVLRRQLHDDSICHGGNSDSLAGFTATVRVCDTLAQFRKLLASVPRLNKVHDQGSIPAHPAKPEAQHRQFAASFIVREQGNWE